MGAATVERNDGTARGVDIRVDLVENVPVLVLVGDLDVRSTGEVRAAVHDHLAHRGAHLTHPMVVDISGVRSVDATALKVLAAATRRAHGLGIRLVLRGASPAFLRMLHLTHLIRLVEVERLAAVPVVRSAVDPRPVAEAVPVAEPAPVAAPVALHQ
jgi:anti-anti-sigma factor